jgi:ATP-dependent exoDNAse (exonuclease V) beta subunit
VGGSSFHEREEVSSIRAALTAIERPDDELSVFAALRGPIFALSDSALLAFRDRVGAPHPFRAVPADAPPEIAEVARALEVLRDLHRGRNRRSIADTIALLMNRTRAHAGFAMWPTGEQALANIVRLTDEARRFEARKEGVSFRGFVDHLERRAEEGTAGEAPVVEEGSDGVRLMTVHGAKGLEFPVVMLADLTCPETASEAARYVDPESRLCALRIAGCSPRDLIDHQADEQRRDREEAVRLLYVAATRARDLIVAPVIVDERPEGWLRTLAPVLYPDSRAARTPRSKQPPGCPEFGDDSVAKGERPEDAPSKARSVAPGLHAPERGSHEVVWWDPSKLTLRVEESMGLRQDALLRADESGIISKRGVELHDQWKKRREESSRAATAPSIKLATVTALAQEGLREGAGAGSIDVQLEETTRDPDRPRGARFGTLLHAIMQDAPFDSDLAALNRIAEFHGRILGATPLEVEAAAVAASRALRSAVMARARAAGANCRREASIVTRLEDGTIVEGIADLAFLEHENDRPIWTVVDFKTDTVIEPYLEAYRTQLRFYAQGIAESTGQAARGVVLWT